MLYSWDRDYGRKLNYRGGPTETGSTPSETYSIAKATVMSENGEEQEDHASAVARRLPLNSRRLTKTHLQLIAET